jgi:hypothetical protein
MLSFPKINGFKNLLLVAVPSLWFTYMSKAQNLNNTSLWDSKHLKIENVEKYIHSGLVIPNTFSNHQYHPNVGATAADVMPKNTVGPNYQNCKTNEDRQRATNLYAMEQVHAEQKRQQEIDRILKENENALNKLNNTRSAQVNLSTSTNYKSQEFATKTKLYTDALQNLKEMLDGKRALSVSDAYYTLESAYGSTYITKKEYDNIIQESALFIKKWLVQNGLDPSNNTALHYGIQKFIGDTLTVVTKTPEGKITQRKTHAPFLYDYSDYKGEQDFRNYFVTKCIATGTGQCNSMPVVYLALAEALGVKTYLTFAPYHSFIKYPDEKGIIHNYEPTSNWRITNEWYMDNLFITDAAFQNGIYLDTLNGKQIIANCIIDLAWGYMQKFGPADGKFVGQCLMAPGPQFPRNNNIYAWFVYGDCLTRKLDLFLRAKGVKDLNELSKYPEAKSIYDEIMKNERLISSLGYQDLPKSVYEKLMQDQEFKGKQQSSAGTNTKQKRNLFTTTFK